MEDAHRRTQAAGLFHAGMATTKPVRRSMRTAPAWVPGLASRRCGGGRKSSSGPDAATDRGRNPERGGCPCIGLSFFFYTDQAVTVVLVAASYDGFAVMVMAVADDPA